MRRVKGLLLAALVLTIVLSSLVFVFYSSNEARAKNNTSESRWNITYVVRPNDTLMRIASELGTTVGSILKLNDISNPDLIYAGQQLKVDAYNELKEVRVSWYGPGFEGRPMANGKIFHKSDKTVVAHKYLPFGTKVRLTYHGKSIIVVVQDRGPFSKVGDKVYFTERRDFDLSEAAAEALGIKSLGVAKCRVEILDDSGPKEK